MFKNAATFTLLFTIVFIVMQWIFRPEIDWIEIIGVAILVFLFYVLFTFVESRYKGKNKK